MRTLASQQLLGLYGPAGKLGRPLLSAAGTRACETAVRCPLAAAPAHSKSIGQLTAFSSSRQTAAAALILFPLNRLAVQRHKLTAAALCSLWIDELLRDLLRVDRLNVKRKAED